MTVLLNEGVEIGTSGVSITEMGTGYDIDLRCKEEYESDGLGCLLGEWTE